MSAANPALDFSPEPPAQLLAGHTQLARPVATALLRELAYQRIPLALYPRRNLDLHGFGHIVECSDEGIAMEIDACEQIRPPGSEADSYVAVAFLGGVKIQFDAALMLADDSRCPLLRGALPMAVYRLQRREAYRVPVLHGSGFCILRRPSAEEFSAPIIDLSITGVQLAWESSERPAVGMKWEHARIEFSDHPPLPCTLIVCRLTEKTNGEILLGCRFGMLPPDVERALQVLVNDLQRASRARH